jgi:hypothetical protein
LTGWPFSPPAALTEEAHASATFDVAPSDDACGPEQLQIIPTRNGEPLAVPVEPLVVPLEALVVPVEALVVPVEALVVPDELFELEPHAATDAASRSAQSDARSPVDFSPAPTTARRA